MSPALKAVLGFLSGHRVFAVAPYSFMGRFDNGEERQIDAHRVHREGDTGTEDRYIADVEGDVWLFWETNAAVICPSSAAHDVALSAFRKAAPLRWFLVI